MLPPRRKYQDFVIWSSFLGPETWRRARLVGYFNRSYAIVLESFILVLTWIRTANIKRVFSQLHIKLSMSSLLLRDGQYIFTCGFHRWAGFLQAHYTLREWAELSNNITHRTTGSALLSLNVLNLIAIIYQVLIRYSLTGVSITSSII